MGFLKNLGKSCKSKAKNSANQTMYTLMWGEEAPKGKKKVSNKKKNDK